MTVNELIEHLQSIVAKDKRHGDLKVVCNEMTAEWAVVEKKDIAVSGGSLEVFPIDYIEN